MASRIHALVEMPADLAADLARSSSELGSLVMILASQSLVSLGMAYYMVCTFPLTSGIAVHTLCVEIGGTERCTASNPNP